MKKLLYILFGVLLALPSIAQDSKGTEFWLMFPSNLNNPNPLKLYITSDVNTSGTVTALGVNYPFVTVAGTITTVNLPGNVQTTTLGAVSNKGVHVVANDEITVYGFSLVGYSTDAFLGFPVDAIGTDYLVMTYKNVNIVAGTQFGIVAAESGTTIVTITPSDVASGHPAGVPYNVVLTQGQTYLLRNTNNNGGDLTGSAISADKKISVFGSHHCANIPAGEVACDHIVEQLPPLSSWGKEFATVPLKTRLNGDTYRFLAQSNSTQVSINGSVVATLNSGDHFETILSGYNRISSNEPILVGQFSNSSSYDGVTSDPFFLLVPPTEQFLTDYTINTGSGNITTNHVNVISESAQTGGVQVDGTTVPSGSWSTIPGTSFSGAQVTLTSAGQHSVTSIFPIGVFVYGFGNYDSYGYLGGQSFSPVATVSSITQTPATATVQSGNQQCVTATVLDQFGDPVAGVKVDFDVSGANTTSGFGNTDANGEVTYCYTPTNGGTDIVVGSIFGLSAQSTITVTVCTMTLSGIPTNLQCNGDNSGAIDLSITGNYGTPTISWTGPNGFTSSSEDISGLEAGTYSVTVSGSLGCSESMTWTLSEPATALTASILVTPSIPVNPGGAANTLYLGYGPTFVDLNASASGGTPVYSYSWSNGDVLATTTVSPNTAGTHTYTLTVTDFNGCTVLQSVDIYVVDVRCGKKNNKVLVCQVPPGNPSNAHTICVSPNAVAAHLATGSYLGTCGNKTQADVAYDFDIYPNPNNGTFNLEIELISDDPITIQINGMDGKIIYEEEVSEAAGLYVHEINIPGKLSQGMYFINLISNENTSVKKFIVQ